MRRLFLALLLLAACDPDLTIVKHDADGGEEGGAGGGPAAVDAGGGRADGGGPTTDGGGTGDGGGDDGGTVDEAGAPKHVIDGVNDFAPGEKFVTTSTSSGYEGYITWDDKRLYIGMQGPDVGSGATDRWVLVYIGGAAGTTTGIKYGGRQQPTLAFPAEYHIRWKADGTYTNGQHWDGANWVDATGSGLVPVASQKGTFMELSVTRAAIGNPAKLQIHLSMIKESGNDWTYSGVPSTSFVDGVDPAYTKYFEFDPTDTTKAPNAYSPKP